MSHRIQQDIAAFTYRHSECCQHLPALRGESRAEHQGRRRVALAELGAPANADALFWICRLPRWDRSMAETMKIGQALRLPAEPGEGLADYRGRLRVALAERLGPHSTDPRVWLARLPRWKKSMPETQKMAQVLNLPTHLGESLPGWRYRIAQALHERLC